VLSDTSITRKCSYQDEYLLVNLDPSVRKINLTKVDGQHIRLVTFDELVEIATSENEHRPHVYLMMRDKGENKELTISYSCISLGEHYDSEGNISSNVSDHFCSGGMVLLFSKEGKDWIYSVISEL